MSEPTSSRRLISWILYPLLGALGGAVVGASAGSLIGEQFGTAEGEGFMGFLYGLYWGPVLGFFAGLTLAWRSRSKVAKG